VNAPNYATTGAQWVVLQTQTVGGVPLSQSDEDWSINSVGLPAAEALNFIADYSQRQDLTGANIPQNNSIFSQTLMSSPVPGLSGTGEGNSGFVSPVGPGPLGNLGAFADTFGLVTNALGTANVGGEIEALEFEPARFTPGAREPSTWAMMLLGFAGLGFLGYRQTAKARLAA
jgi:hypothetical protein